MKFTCSGRIPVTGLAGEVVTTSVRGSRTVMDRTNPKEPPTLSVTVRVTLNLPAVEYVCDAVALVAVVDVPSPKSQ